MSPGPLYRPPAPRALPPVRALLRSAFSGSRDLLSLLPEEAYRTWIAPLGVSRRGILLVNEPDMVRRIFGSDVATYPKNDLFVGALRPLIGDGVFVSDGDVWKRQRQMIEPSFGHMQVGRAFAAMEAATGAVQPILDARAADGEVLSLDAAVSHLTADIICRAVFSTTLESDAARRIFEDFAVFQETVANVRIARLLWGRPWAEVSQPAPARAACERIRRQIAGLIAARTDKSGEGARDIAGDIISARDPATGIGFSQQELVDQIGVFFLAGHETSATAVLWALFVLSQNPDLAARVRAEIDAEAGDGPIGLESVKRLALTRAVLRETLRLYPPGPFLPRVAARETEIGGYRLRRGAMVMVSPWIIHRHSGLWRNPDLFDESRFLSGSDAAVPAGAYLPFGLGPRVCIGAAFATVESTFLIAHLIRRYDIEVCAPEAVRPVARLTTRPARDIRVRLSRR
ncbi:MAG: cytochrome P450 [Alphaproteobacteria bacterium]|nr:cytochrome P450 [Alphaproteobacteria bacterium]